ncbi:hypothetical protein ACLBX9_09970 [Methylobacterium sp. A49B]
MSEFIVLALQRIDAVAVVNGPLAKINALIVNISTGLAPAFGYRLGYVAG